MITGKTLIDWGFTPGKWFKQALYAAQNMEKAGHDHDTIFKQLQADMPVELLPRTNSLDFNLFLEPENDVEKDNLAGVITAMDALMRTPTIVSGAVMPDACPAGIIPVGGVVATKDAIHPGFHSADICCSMAITVFRRDDDPKRLLDIAESITHFGPGGRKDIPMSKELHQAFQGNRFLSDLEETGDYAMGTQGDGNHFLFVGRIRSTGQLAMVTHHGSRAVGAHLYNRGMRVAERHTRIVSPKTPKQAAWIDANSDEGRAYWDALQIIRDWTKENHFAIHDRVAQRFGNAVEQRWWNEHNFVFRRDDGLYYHAKGATPNFRGFAADDQGLTLIPLNMAEPVLIASHVDNKGSLGFAPHGAGRNMSRTAYLRDVVGNRPIEELMPKDIDVRFFQEKPDLSELPQAYKSADQVRRQIVKHSLGEVVDYVDPYGSIMAGNDGKDWAAIKRAKRVAR
jgi:tRNA-splicing ligase RtcB